jgi:predicted DNA-binding transcriptional regulator YafY
MELLRYAINVKVLAPENLIATIKERVGEMADLYQ